MLRAMLRDLRAHKGRVSMMLVAIVLGVAFVVATWVVSDSVAQTMAGAASRTDVAVAVQAWDPEIAFTTADRDRLAAIPGATGASGVVIGHAALVQRDGKLSRGWHDRDGTSWDSSPRFALTAGRGPVKQGEVALGESEARTAKFAVGDTVRVMLADGTSDRAVVVGVFAYRPLGAESPPTVAYDGDTALKLLGGRYDRIELGGSQPDALATAAKQVVGSDRKVQVQTRAELIDEARRNAEEAAVAMKMSLLAFAGVAVLAGMFVIANTFTMLVAQRTRQFALLRAVGASRRQVRRAVIAEAGVLGFIGATIGVAAGIGLALLALAVLRPEGQTMVYAISPAGIAVGYAIGVVVTVVSAYGSARRGAAVAPVAALRTDAALPRRALVVRTVLGLVTIAAGATAIAATASTHLDNTKRFIGMSGAIVVWLGLLLLAPLLASAVLRPLSRLLGRRGGPVGRLAVRNAIRDPRRTAATASALMVGLALVCAFATVGESFVALISSSIRAMVPASTAVVESASRGSLLTPDVVDKVRTTPGVTAALAVPRAWVNLDHGGTTSGGVMSTVDPAGFTATLRPRIVSGSADLRGGAIILKATADELKLHPGDTVTVSFDPDGGSKAMEGRSTRQVRVAGVYEATEYQPDLWVDAAVIPPGAHSHLTTVYATGADPAAVRKALDGTFQDRPDVVVTDREGLIEEIVSDFRLALSVIYALFGAALIIAVFGVVNTLALSVMERTREIGVFRAVGAGRRLVRRTVRLESLVITSYGGLLGVAVGLGLGAVMQHVMLTQELWKIGVPYQVIGIALVGMVVVGVLAALWPARRAARTDVLAAIATE